MINRASMFAIVASLATNVATFTTATHATPLSRELAVESAAQRKLKSVHRAGWGRWVGRSGAGWGFVGPGCGRGWMGNGWGGGESAPTSLRSMCPASAAGVRFQPAEVGQGAWSVDEHGAEDVTPPQHAARIR
jgi:hypothetical protein